MNNDLLNKILDADISRPIKEEILSYWLLPPKEGPAIAPIQKTETRSGSIKRPTKEQLDLKNNPKEAEGIKEMEATLEGVLNE